MTRLCLSGSRPNPKMPRLSKLHQNEATAASAFSARHMLCLKKKKKNLWEEFQFLRKRNAASLHAGSTKEVRLFLRFQQRKCVSPVQL